MCCSCCPWFRSAANTVPFDSIIGLDQVRHSAAMQVSAFHARGCGQAFAEQPILQDRAYWEVTVQNLTSGMSVGVAAAQHTVGDKLNAGTAWALTPSDFALLVPAGLGKGDIIGVALDQADFPVSLTFWHNGKELKALRGPNTEATPLIELPEASDEVQVNFVGPEFAHAPASGSFSGIIKARSLL